MDRHNLLIWGLGAAGLGLVRYIMLRNRYPSPRSAVTAAAASAMGDLAGVAIPQIQNPAMLLAAQQAQAAAQRIYQKVPQGRVDRCKPTPEKPVVVLPVRNAEFKIIEEDDDPKKGK